ncbi:MAG TPA: hypothetical protein VEA35_03815 [Ramlibacter sp.]|nr:hypothetical protein [Ramlibacter sp.]
MNHRTALGAALIAAAAGFALQAHAQTQNPSTGPGASSATSNKAGEAYPNDPNAANKNKPKAAAVQKAENSGPVQTTKRVARKATDATKRMGNKAAGTVRNTGEAINKKVPPGPNDAKQ